ncbi:protein ALP1-like [Senna tora]|uniref:Protein ALP1-like n=1 Tax=Senna tora TaxID=362788 RepID=A0A834U3N5_9FABA|nr:protein ALP1-like [Senna tora]
MGGEGRSLAGNGGGKPIGKPLSLVLFAENSMEWNVLLPARARSLGGKWKKLEHDGRGRKSGGRRWCCRLFFVFFNVMDEVTTETIGEIIVCMVTLMVALHNCLMHEALTIGVHRNRLPSRSYTLDFHEKRAHLKNLAYSNDSNCYNVLRMYRATFDRLCSMLDEIGGLKPTKHMLVDDKYFKAVLKAIIRLHRVLYKTPNPVLEDSTDPRWKWFKNCLGALDGTHIRIRVHKDDQTRFRNRKGDLTINVLGVCSQDAQFIYVLSGWEGSAANGRVLKSALDRPRGFKVPADRYYLVDVGYSNAEGFLAPYRGQRYHLNEWREGRHPTTPRECFNMRHSAARNVIERCFGMLKNRWAIMRSPSFYPVKTHNMIVIACCLLHNLIRRENVGDPLNDEAENLDPEPAEEHAEVDGPISTVETSESWTLFRENLAAQMFNEFRRGR